MGFRISLSSEKGALLPGATGGASLPRGSELKGGKCGPNSTGAGSSGHPTEQPLREPGLRPPLMGDCAAPPVRQWGLALHPLSQHLTT